jgi:RNA polymerase sigma-70 factor (ECF subfamily)
MGDHRARPAVGASYASRLELSADDAADVHRFVGRRVANLADAADIAQQTLLLAFSKRGSCRGENLSGWLFTIARNLIVDHYRTQNRFQFEEVEALAETEPALQTASDAVLLLCQRRERLRGWLDCITDQLRLEEQVAVLLADVYGHRDKDSAAVLRMSVPCFKLLLHGARARLHEIAGGDRTRAKKASATVCDEPANGHGGKNAKPGNGGPPSGPPTYRAVIGRLSAPELVALRAEMLEALAW